MARASARGARHREPEEVSAVEGALDRLSLLDLSGTFASLESWIASTPDTLPSTPAVSFLLFDAVCRVDRLAREVKPGSGMSEDQRLLLAQRLGLCETHPERKDVFLKAVRQILDSVANGTSWSAPVEKARDYVASNFTHRISLREVARVAGISPNYLSHRFHRECGSTLTQFVNRLRVREAVKLLRNGTKSISEIAYLVGYQNYRDFHRNFVKLEKTPPKRYRREQGPPA